MKKVSVIVLVVVGLLFAAYAEAAKPKRRTRNANRIGPYAGALVGQSRYTGDQGEAEAFVADYFSGVPTQNLAISTDDTDISYAAQFGYRFTRYFAAEFALAQYGDLRSLGKGQVDLGSGFTPASVEVSFHTSGPKFSAVGILPLGDKFELYGQAGVLFAGSERQVVTRLEGSGRSFGSAKGDSTEYAFGVGAAWHLNQMYTVRAQIEKLTDVGEDRRTGTEDLTTASIGLIVRF